MYSKDGPRVFISYGHEDVESAVKLFNQLTAHGANVWIDKESLLPGMDWKREIRKVIQNCRYFILLLSSSSVNRKGFVNVEISSALEILNEYPKNEIYLIPVRLNDCMPTHDELSNLHWLDLFPDWNNGFYKLLKTLDLSKTERDSSILNVRICGRCGRSNLRAVEFRRDPVKAYCIFCNDCDWQWIGPEDLSDEELDSLRLLYGNVKVEYK